VGLAEHLTTAAAAIEQHDYETLARVAHTLKGSLLQCGLDHWAAMAQEIYDGARENQDLPFAERLAALKQGLSTLL